MEDTGKTIGMISYITPIGWIIAYIMHSNEAVKSEFALFHLRQSLGIFIVAVLFSVIVQVLSNLPFLGSLFSFLGFLVQIGVFVLWIMGLVAAAKGEKKEVPVIGNIIQNIFSGIR